MSLPPSSTESDVFFGNQQYRTLRLQRSIATLNTIKTFVLHFMIRVPLSHPPGGTASNLLMGKFCSVRFPHREDILIPPRLSYPYRWGSPATISGAGESEYTFPSVGWVLSRAVVERFDFIFWEVMAPDGFSAPSCWGSRRGTDGSRPGLDCLDQSQRLRRYIHRLSFFGRWVLCTNGSIN